MSKTYDVTVTITPALPTWPGDPPVRLERVNKIEDGANANVSQLAISVHTGTHVDAPYHFLQEGDTVENLPLDVLLGEAQLVVFPKDCKEITSERLEKAGIQPGVTRLLLKTSNSEYWADPAAAFQVGFVGVTLDGARWLVEKGIRLVGIDYLSIAPYKRSRPTHEVLLKAGMVVIEGLDLRTVPSGNYRLICLPLKLGKTDGSPARVVLQG